jgi:aerobic-type carbon monoxide dehydrogenase small subunit (CoxS/CutS family)
LCGACTVHVDGVATRSCITTVESVSKAHLQTIESLSHSRVGKGLQKAWLDLDVVQCGYCQSDQLMSVFAQASKPQPLRFPQTNRRTDMLFDILTRQEKEDATPNYWRRCYFGPDCRFSLTYMQSPNPIESNRLLSMREGQLFRLPGTK